MKVIVFGATGGTGRAAVQELLDGGHEVTAFSRHTDQLGLRSERLHLQSGDALRAEDVERAVAGHDAVVVALGVSDNPFKVRLLHRSGTPVNICSEGTRRILEGMKKQGVRKLVVVSAYGVGDTREKLPLPIKLLYKVLLQDQIDDKEIQERMVRESGLDWTIVRPVGLTNKAPEPEDKVLVSAEGEMRGSFIPRRNVGRFLARAVAGDQFLHRSVALSG